MDKLDQIVNPCIKHAKVSVTGEGCVCCMLEQIAELEAEMNDSANKLMRAQEQIAELEARLVFEKERRVYYQGIVYMVCNVLDKIDSKGVADGITVDEIEARMKLIKDDQAKETTQ